MMNEQQELEDGEVSAPIEEANVNMANLEEDAAFKALLISIFLII